MTAQWQKNQSGTHYSDYKGFMISVQREAPRSRQFCARIEGVYVGTFTGMEPAQKAAELAAEQCAGSQEHAGND